MYDCSRAAITLNNLNIPAYDIHSREGRDQMLVNLYELQESFVKINQQLIDKSTQQKERLERLRIRVGKCNDKLK